MFGIDDAAIESALTRPAQWRIPNDYPAVRRMQNTAEVQKESSVQKAIKKMAVSASGFMDDGQEKKKRFGLFGLSRA
jgi:hypothetical protein